MAVSNTSIQNRIVWIWAVSGILLLLAAGIFYLRFLGFAEQGEVTFAAVSWLAANGQPVYTTLDAAERYSLQHGPNVFLVIGTVMKLLGPGYATAKLANVVAAFLVMALSWLTLRKLVAGLRLVGLLGLEAWVLLHWHYIFAARPDSLMLLCIAIALFVLTVVRTRPMLLLGLALPLGFLINLKMHGVLYFLPVLALLIRQMGWRFTLATVLVSLPVAVMPFLFPQVSFENYVLWLKLSTTQGILLKNVVDKLALGLALVLVFLLVGRVAGADLRSYWSRWQGVILTAAGSFGILCIVGSKPGSGTNHLMPLIPVYIYLMGQMLAEAGEKATALEQDGAAAAGRLRTVKAVLVILVLVLTAGGFGKAHSLMERNFQWDRREALAEIDEVATAYAGRTMEVGYGSGQKFGKYRDFNVVPVFRGNPYLIDSVALGDLNSNKVPVPAATLRKLEEGAVQVWLIPSGEKPFSTGESSGDYYFGQSFFDTFNKNYVLKYKTKHFDVWIHNTLAECASG